MEAELGTARRNMDERRSAKKKVAVVEKGEGKEVEEKVVEEEETGVGPAVELPAIVQSLTQMPEVPIAETTEKVEEVEEVVEVEVEVEEVAVVVEAVAVEVDAVVSIACCIYPEGAES